MCFTTPYAVPLLFPELGSNDYYRKDEYSYALISERAVEKVKTYEQEIIEWSYSLALATKLDIKQVNQVCQKMGIRGTSRKEFGDFLETIKYDQGKPGNANFTWKELIELAKEFLGE